MVSHLSLSESLTKLVLGHLTGYTFYCILLRFVLIEINILFIGKIQSMTFNTRPFAFSKHDSLSSGIKEKKKKIEPFFFDNKLKF